MDRRFRELYCEPEVQVWQEIVLEVGCNKKGRCILHEEHLIPVLGRIPKRLGAIDFVDSVPIDIDRLDMHYECESRPRKLLQCPHHISNSNHVIRRVRYQVCVMTSIPFQCQDVLSSYDMAEYANSAAEEVLGQNYKLTHSDIVHAGEITFCYEPKR